MSLDSHNLPANIRAAMNRAPVFAAPVAVLPVLEPEPTPAQQRWAKGEERKLNELVCAELRRRGIPHVVARTDKESTIRRGWPDISAFRAGKGCCVELKATAGKLTAAQKECIAELESAGVPVLVAYDFDSAIQFILANV